MKITFWLRNDDKKYWQALIDKGFKPSEIISCGIKLVFADVFGKVIEIDKRNHHDK